MEVLGAQPMMDVVKDVYKIGLKADGSEMSDSLYNLQRGKFYFVDL